jgi:hypothetical protein
MMNLILCVVGLAGVARGATKADDDVLDAVQREGTDGELARPGL